MKFRDFQKNIKPLPAFNLNDIRKLDPNFHRQQLRDWLERGFVLSLVGGYYRLPETRTNEHFLFMLANRVYEPSYISRESALAYYHIIPETVFGVTSVSSRKTNKFESAWGILSYRSIKPALMFGYRIVDYSDSIKYKIASLEKAILDYLYWKSDIASVDDFEGLRWNRHELFTLKQNSLFQKYLQIFDSKTLNNRVSLLMEYLYA